MTPAYSTADINAATLNSAVGDIRSGLVTPINSPVNDLRGQASGLIQAPIQAITGAAAAVVQNIGTQVRATLAPVFNVITEVSKIVSFVASTVAEFSRISFASATKSPLATARKVRDLICKAIDFAKTYKISNLLAGFSWPPKLPAGLKNFSVKKFIQKLVRKIEEKIAAFIYDLVMSYVNKILAIIKKISDLIMNLYHQLLDLFTCNPGDKK